MLDRIDIERRDSCGDDGMMVRREVDRQRLPGAGVSEHARIVQRQGACLIVQGQYELLDELAPDDAVNVAADGRWQLIERQGQRHWLGESFEAHERPRRS